MGTEDLHAETGQIDRCRGTKTGCERRNGSERERERDNDVGGGQEGGSCASRVGRSAKAPCGA